MDKLEKLEEVANLWQSLRHDERLVRLQQLMTDPACIEAIRGSIAEDMAGREINTFLWALSHTRQVPSLLPRVNAEPLEVGEEVSILDIAGNFIWTTPSSSFVFQLSHSELLKSNIFSLMDDTSIASLVSNYGSELFKSRKPIMIAYTLKSGRRLVSLLSEAMLCTSTYTRYGILLRTRQRRKSIALLASDPADQNHFMRSIPSIFHMPLSEPCLSARANSPQRSQPNGIEETVTEQTFSLAAHMARLRKF